jgi:type II secretory pathway pseudopilin PulG
VIRTRLASERGLATPIVIAVMSVVALLAAAGALAALGASEGANDDRRSKRALAAAEAGIQRAAFRLANRPPEPSTMCSGVDGASVAKQNGECPAVTGTVGPDTSFEYVATEALLDGAYCAGNIQPDPTATDHCITATGIVGTVRRRLQARIRIARGDVFSNIGLLGRDSVKMVNSINVWSDIGSNGLIDGDNSIVVNRPAHRASGKAELRIAPAAQNPTISGSSPSVVRLTAPWPELAQTDFASIAASNNNSQLSGLPLNRWNPATKTLSGSLTLPGGSYHLCDYYADDSVTVTLHANATPSNPVRLYIDSPTRPGSGCSATSGRFCLDNSVNFNEGGDPAELQIYVYGSTATCGQWSTFDGSSYSENAPVILNNSVNFRGKIYAPTSTVRLNNSVNADGSIIARVIHLENSINFRHMGGGTGSPATAGPVRRLAWVECRSRPTPSTDPESGCT